MLSECSLVFLFKLNLSWKCNVGSTIKNAITTVMLLEKSHYQSVHILWYIGRVISCFWSFYTNVFKLETDNYAKIRTNSLARWLQKKTFRRLVNVIVNPGRYADFSNLFSAVQFYFLRWMKVFNYVREHSIWLEPLTKLFTLSYCIRRLQREYKIKQLLLFGKFKHNKVLQ